MERTDVRYDKRQVQKVIELLENWMGQTEESMDNTTNDDRLDSLQQRYDSLETARDALQEAIDG